MDGHGVAAIQLVGAVVVQPQGTAGRGVVQVQRTLLGNARERDAAHVDLRPRGYGRTRCQGIDGSIDIDEELRQGVHERELHLLVDSGRALHVDPWQTDGQRLCAAVHLGPCAVARSTYHAPAEVDGVGGVEGRHVLDDSAVLGHTGDAPGVLIGIHLTARGRHVDMGRIGEERHLVGVVADGGVAVFVGPVLHGFIAPRRGRHLLVIHEVGRVELVVLVQVGIVAEHTETLVFKIDLTGHSTAGDQHTGRTRTRHAALGVGVETDGQRLILLRGLYLRACLQAIIVGAGSEHHRYDCKQIDFSHN